MTMYVIKIHSSDGCTYSYTETEPVKYYGSKKELINEIKAQCRKHRKADASWDKKVKIRDWSCNWSDLLEGTDDWNFEILTLEEWCGVKG